MTGIRNTSKISNTWKSTPLHTFHNKDRINLSTGTIRRAKEVQKGMNDRIKQLCDEIAGPATTGASHTYQAQQN
jgi:hypothetical protein